MSEYSPIAYRIAIADEVGATEFREIVLQSNSNTDGAIHFRRPQLEAIAQKFGLSPSQHQTVGTLRSAIFSAAQDSSSSTPTGSRNPISADGGISQPYTVEKLSTIANAIKADPDPPYREVEMRQLSGSPIAGSYLAHLLEKAYLDLYLSVNVGSTTAERGNRAYFPFQVEPADEIPETADEHPPAQQYIVDSAYNDPDIGNSYTLDTAARVGADSAILADVFGDLEKTIERVIDGIEMYNNHPFDGDIIVPLQGPWDECYQRLRDRGVSHNHTFALGGLKDATTAEKIDAAKSVREQADYDITLHGLGFGITDQLAKEIRNHPKLLDSVDYSTAIQNQIRSSQQGDERLCSAAAATAHQYVEDLRSVSPLVQTQQQNQKLSDFSTQN
jgi:hypothetical protein